MPGPDGRVSIAGQRAGFMGRLFFMSSLIFNVPLILGEYSGWFRKGGAEIRAIPSPQGPATAGIKAGLAFASKSRWL